MDDLTQTIQQTVAIRSGFLNAVTGAIVPGAAMLATGQAAVPSAKADDGSLH